MTTKQEAAFLRDYFLKVAALLDKKTGQPINRAAHYRREEMRNKLREIRIKMEKTA